MKKVLETMTERKTEIQAIAWALAVLAILAGLTIGTVLMGNRETGRSYETTIEEVLNDKR